jgi:CheY-like chemotaxis protein
MNLAYVLLKLNVAKTSDVQRNILIVDDEKLFLKSLREGLRPHAKKHNFKILTAEDGRKAIEVLENEDVLLLITDIKMPEIDGLKLISHAISHFPTLPVVVMTAYGSPQIKRMTHEKGVLRYLEKPVEFDEILAIILDVVKRGTRRRVQGVTLPSFLQLLEMEKSNCRLTVEGENARGFIFISNGQMVEAEADGSKGVAAVLEMLDWSKMQIELEETSPAEAEAARTPITEVLLQAFKLKDEKAKKAAGEEEELSIEIEETSRWELPIESDPARKDVVERQEPLADSPRAAAAVRDISRETKVIQIKIDSGYKEVYMNIPKLNKAVDVLKESLGAALIATDIFGSEDGQSIAGYNSQPAASAVFTQITNMINTALVDSKFPPLGRYFLLDLVDKKMVICLPMGDFIWGMLVDGSKTQLGVLLNLAIPKAIGAFEEALAE